MKKLTSDEYLKIWRDFRGELAGLPLETALLRVAEYWQSAHFVPYYLDLDLVSTWPDPWSLIAENYFCDIGKALGIIHTIEFSVCHFDFPELRVYYDAKKDMEYHCAVFDQYILNLVDGEVSSFGDVSTFEVRRIIGRDELKLDNYR